MRQSSDKYKLALCFVADDAFIKGTSVMIHSFLRENFDESIDIWCFYDSEISSFSDRSMSVLKSLCPKIKFKKVDNPYYRDFPVCFQGHNLSLLKFESFLMTQYDYVMYIDTDTIFMQPIGNIIEILKESPYLFLCVENRSRSRSFKVFKFASFSANAGFFVIKNDSSKVALEVLYEEFLLKIEAACESGEKRKMICQPIFNETLAELGLEYIAAPMFYNYRTLNLYKEHRHEIVILHFVTRNSTVDKPWQIPIEGNVDESVSYWWESYSYVHSLLHATLKTQ